MSYHNVIYTIENGIAYANFNNRNKTIWNKRWFKTFDTAYVVSATIVNGTITARGLLFGNETVKLTITPNEGYSLPETVIVTGATFEYDAETGIITLSDPTNNITISAECEQSV